MHRVRYYSQLIEPSYFKGLRGWWIRVLNRIRLAVELRVSKHVLRYLAAEDGYSKFKVKELFAEFRKDAREEQARLKVASLESRSVMETASSLPREGSEKVGSRRTTEAMLARLLAGPRSKRYTKDRQGRHFGDLDGDFEPVQEVELPTVEVSYARNEHPKSA